MDISSALIVDDSKMARMTLKKQLESRDIAVHLSESGVDSLEYLKQNQPDIIFMDCLMPGIDGFETVQKILSNPKTNSIPIVMCTGKESAEDKRKALDLGAVGYMTKSSTSEPLDAVLDELQGLNDKQVDELIPQMYTPSKDNMSPFDSSEIARIAELSAKTITERVINKKISELNTQYAQDLNTKLKDLTEKVEKIVLFSVKSSLQEIHEYMNSEREQLHGKFIPELKKEVNGTIEQSLREIKDEFDDFKTEFNELDIDKQVEDKLKRSLLQELEKYFPEYAQQFLLDPETHDTIKIIMNDQMSEQNRQIEALKAQIEASKQSIFNPFNIVTFFLALGALAAAVYPLLK